MQSGLLGTVSADQSHQTVFIQEQFCLLKAGASGTVFLFAPTSRPAQLWQSGRKAILENGVVAATFSSIATEV